MGYNLAAFNLISRMPEGVKLSVYGKLGLCLCTRCRNLPIGGNHFVFFVLNVFRRLFSRFFGRLCLFLFLLCFAACTAGCIYADFRCGDDAVKAAVTCADEAAAMDTVVRLLSMLPGNNLTTPVVYECDGVGQAVCERAEEAIAAFADPDTVMPLYAKDDGRYNVAFARIGGVACGCIVLAGDDVCDCRARRAARFMRLCDAFSLPVITFVDAAAFASLDGASKVSHAYAEATCAKITVITGRAYGPVYIAAAGKTAGADAVLAWPSAVISPLAPETAIHILWSDRMQHMADPAKEREALAAEYAATEGSPVKAAAEGYVTDVITPAETAGRLSALLEMLAGKRVSRLPKKHSNIQL